MKTNKTKYLIIGSSIIFILWILSWILLMTYLPDQTIRGQFGDMFGAVNSLFSGLALCGVVYTIFLQYESNKTAEYQFKFNHLIDIVNRQVDTFNNRIIEFSFTHPEKSSIKFDTAIEYYRTISTNEEDLTNFIAINKEIIFSIIPFIFQSNKFVYELINEESISEKDKSRLKDLFFRSQNRNIIDFYTLNTKCILYEKEEMKDLSEDLKAIQLEIFNIRKSMTLSILNNDYR